MTEDYKIECKIILVNALYNFPFTAKYSPAAYTREDASAFYSTVANIWRLLVLIWLGTASILVFKVDIASNIFVDNFFKLIVPFIFYFLTSLSVVATHAPAWRKLHRDSSMRCKLSI